MNLKQHVHAAESNGLLIALKLAAPICYAEVAEQQNKKSLTQAV
jgi:hypothetical protein